MSEQLKKLRKKLAEYDNSLLNFSSHAEPLREACDLIEKWENEQVEWRQEIGEAEEKIESLEYRIAEAHWLLEEIIHQAEVHGEDLSIDWVQLECKLVLSEAGVRRAAKGKEGGYELTKKIESLEFDEYLHSILDALKIVASDWKNANYLEDMSGENLQRLMNAYYEWRDMNV